MDQDSTQTVKIIHTFQNGVEQEYDVQFAYFSDADNNSIILQTVNLGCVAITNDPNTIDTFNQIVDPNSGIDIYPYTPPVSA